MATRKPVEVAIIGGGCAAIAAAFELTQPRHKGAYHVTIYQMGWRLGGKGASGRGIGGRIEEHGLHVWLGFYDNAFLLLRQCYEELNRTAGMARYKEWRDHFLTDSYIAVAGNSAKGDWTNWAAFFPPSKGLPGDPLDPHNPFTIQNYFAHAAALLRTLLLGMEPFQRENHPRVETAPNTSKVDSVLTVASIAELLRKGVVSSAVVAAEALAVVAAALKGAQRVPENALLKLMEVAAAAVRRQLEQVILSDDQIKFEWEIIDLFVAIFVGAIRFGLFTNPRGFDAINHFDCREWLRLNGASERALNSPFARGLYDLALAYVGGDGDRPAVAAGQALRGTMRMFFGYRGALFWKMRAGMGDVVFVPFYEALRRRGVTFKFFHRLRNVKLAHAKDLAPGEKPYVEALEFDVQAEPLNGADYHPLIDVRGMPCWPARPDFAQLKHGMRMRREGWNFESHWDRRKVSTRELRVTRDFDFVVLGIGLGAVPHVCREILAADQRWRTMVHKVQTVATQTFQLWLNKDLQDLGWEMPPVTMTGFVKPFDTWADMGQVIPAEDWRRAPKTVVYFCGVLPDPQDPPSDADVNYPRRRKAEVRRNAVTFLCRDIGKFWPRAVQRSGEFRWELLVEPEMTHKRGSNSRKRARFESQFWTANVNPSDRHVLALPGSLEHRISPLDNTYDNLTIAGDWTDCGFNEGCVEAAVMSGRLAAHAIARWPAIEDIIGYDHP